MKNKIDAGCTYLGIELGSTRIKACLIDETYAPIASGSFEWENKLENGYWTYSLDLIHKGVSSCFADLSKNVSETYGTKLTKVSAIGVSGMMHGYMPFDKNGTLLTPFRTWRNTTTEKAATELSSLFDFHIPQRWSIAHLYQAILNGEEHVGDIAYITTVAGYIHYLLSGKLEVGVGEASGIFPIADGEYDPQMLDKFDALVSKYGYPWKIRDLLPKVKSAGEAGAYLTEDGARFLDKDGYIEAGIPICAPEGDGGTGMVATNSVLAKTGNVSAGTSIFSMLVLERPLSKNHEAIDIVTTPDGKPVAMVHCNNCSSEFDAWVRVFGEFATAIGADISKGELYETLYRSTLGADLDCGGVCSYNYLSGEHLTEVESGRPMYFRLPSSNMTLGNFMRSQIYSAMSTLKLGMDILFKEEGVGADKFTAHGGLFKTRGISQQIMADALNTPIAVSETAGEGGAWGMALLAAYMIKGSGNSLGDWLSGEVFGGMSTSVLYPNADGVAGFDRYIERYKEGLTAEKALQNT